MLAFAACAACRAAQVPEGAGAHDACVPLAVTTAATASVQQAGIAGALALWRGRGVSAFDAAPAGAGAPTAAATQATIAVEFADAASTFHGVYDPDGDRVLINTDLTDSATLAIVIAHELGHAFGLVHIPATTRLSLMNPDNLVTPPTDADQQAVEVLWGRCR